MYDSIIINVPQRVVKVEILNNPSKRKWIFKNGKISEETYQNSTTIYYLFLHSSSSFLPDEEKLFHLLTQHPYDLKPYEILFYSAKIFTKLVPNKQYLLKLQSLLK